jgi:hypothetical protein
MRYRFYPRISSSRGRADSRQGAAGTATLIVLLLFFVFSVLGLSLACLLHLSLKVSAAKRRTIVLGYAAELGLKRGYDELRALLEGRGLPLILSEERAAELQEAAGSGGDEIISESLGAGPPFAQSGRWEDQAWEVRTDFSLERTQEEEGFFLATFRGVTRSRGTIPEARGRHLSSSQATLSVAVGRVPITYFPLLVERPPTGEDPAGYARNRGITISTQERGLAIPLPAFAEPGLMPQDACPALSDALRIKIFRPQDLTTRALRQALRLEPSEDPVPDGVYLIQSDLGLGGVFVQGDLQSLVLAIDEGEQVLHFKCEAGAWTLRFRPQPPSTVFSTPAETFEYDGLPAGTVVVNGKIESLGGGGPDGSGGYEIGDEEETPCLLHGVILTIVSSDTLTLTSHLIRQGVVWQDGIPYLKEADSKLTLYTTGVDMITGEPSTGGIVIGPGAPADLKVEASLVAPGRGFIVEGDDRTVRLEGSLQASRIEDGSNALALMLEPARLDPVRPSPAVPGTAWPVLMVRGFRVRVWKDKP